MSVQGTGPTYACLLDLLTWFLRVSESLSFPLSLAVVDRGCSSSSLADGSSDEASDSDSESLKARA